MKTQLTFLVLFICSHSLLGQPANMQWQNSLGGSGNEYAYKIIQTPDNGFIVMGHSESSDGDVSENKGNMDYWLVKLNGAGQLEWERSYGGSGYEFGYSVINTSDGGYLIGGQSESTDGDVSNNHGMNDAWAVKLNSVGDIQWEKSYGGSLNEYITGMIETTDGGFLFIAPTTSNDGDITNNQGERDYWIFKTNAQGTIEWQKTYGGSESDYAQDVKQTPNGGYIVTGMSRSTDGDITNPHGGYDYWVLKLDPIGDMEWQKNYGGSQDDYSLAILLTDDNGYIISGYSKSNNGEVSGNHGGNDYWVVKIDGAGNLEWQKCYGGSADDLSSYIVESTNGGYVISGVSFSTDGDITNNHGERDAWVLEIDSSGGILWQSTFGGSDLDTTNAVVATSDFGYALAGYSKSNDGDVSGNHGQHDFWVFKLDGVLSLEQYVAVPIVIYPNPVHTSLYLASKAPVTEISISNLLGQEVLFKRDSGISSVNIENLSKGVYILTATIQEGRTFTQKIIKQ
ncbi:T9SS type A sorting domain-containing protein [Aequorivita todarodis]|uniref:T9SS type A sorting domain-containing protein n=1 Tax=Aequorivita todarodis TaxID=2036821 RepID=UPI00234FC075|nr:T9SS type A sorting domain-containing protein [Aequorivita todarodis]MDC8001421.1 T9SS type A sorting domain-containing protein [Aequorivita todarodis]